MKQGVIYTRFSPRPGAENCQSIEFQEDACRVYCKQRGLDVLAVYRDAALSGRNMDRPGLNKAIKQVIKIRGVLVSYSLARLSRGTVDAIHICEQLSKRNCDLVSVTEQIDTQTPMGRAIYKIMAVFAELERETTSERTKVTLRAMQAKGISVSKFPPYGYFRKPTEQINAHTGRKVHILVTNPSERKAIEVIKHLRRQGLSYEAVGKELTKRGFVPRGKEWYAKTVSNIYNDNV